MPLPQVSLISYHFPPDNTAAAIRPHFFAKYLTRLGYSVHGVARDGDFYGARCWQYAEASKASLTRGGASLQLWRVVQRLTKRYSDRLPWIPGAASLLKPLLRNAIPDSVVFSTSPPLASHLVALALRQNYCFRWIADFQDPLFGNPFHTGKFNTAIDGFVEALIVKRADALVANTEPLAESWKARYPYASGKINVITNGFDSEDKLTSAVGSLSEERTVISHVGDLYGGRHPAELIRSLDRLIVGAKMEPSKVLLNLVGPIEDTLGFLELDATKRLKDLRCLQFNGSLVSREESLRAMQASSYLLLLDMNARNLGLQIPSKIFDYIRIGRGIIAFTPRGSPTEVILQKSGISFVCLYPDESHESLDSKLLSFLKNSPGREHPSSWFYDQFKAEALTHSLVKIIRGL